MPCAIICANHIHRVVCVLRIDSSSVRVSVVFRSINPYCVWDVSSGCDGQLIFGGKDSEFRCTSSSKTFQFFCDPASDVCVVADASKIVKTIGVNRRPPTTYPEREENGDGGGWVMGIDGRAKAEREGKKIIFCGRSTGTIINYRTRRHRGLRPPAAHIAPTRVADYPSSPPFFTPNRAFVYSSRKNVSDFGRDNFFYLPDNHPNVGFSKNPFTFPWPFYFVFRFVLDSRIPLRVSRTNNRRRICVRLPAIPSSDASPGTFSNTGESNWKNHEEKRT